MERIKGLAVILGTLALVLNLAAPVNAAASLSDIKSTHWAYSTIVWAASTGVVKGYPDGTFKPNKEVSEAEFLMMFISAYQTVTPVSGQKHWADPVYAVATAKNWPVKGVSNTTSGKATRDTPITRGEVANIIAGANGINYIGNDAIQYLLNTNLSGGKTGNTVAGYKATDKLTRAEAVAFVKKAKDAGLTELKERPRFPSDKPVTAPVTNAPASIKTVQTAATTLINNSSAYAGYTVSANETTVTVKNEDGKQSINYKLPQSATGNNRMISFDASNNASLKLAADLLKAAGVPVPSDFAAKLEAAVVSGATSTATYGGYTVTIMPDETAYDTLTILFKKP